jgi:zinc transport system substrate-binding protein
VALLALTPLLAAACGQAPPPPPARLLVLATFYPLYDFARQVAGDHAEVKAFVPAGIEPHDWEPSPRDIIELERAAVFIYNGGGFEPWAEKLLEGLGRAGTEVVRATDAIPLVPAARAGPPHGHAHTAGTRDAPGSDPRGPTASPEPARAPDPHVWLDPVLAQRMVENIRIGLARRDPARAAAYGERARAFQARLAALHAAYEAGLRDCARREIVVSHAAFTYPAARYGLTVVSAMGAAPGIEPSPADIAAIARFARQRKVKYIFFETLVSPKLAETLAREVGARTLVLNPIEGLTRHEQAAGKDYVALMEDNLGSLRTALECR